MATILLIAGSSGCRLHVLSPHNMLPPDQSIFVFVSISPRQEYQQVSIIMVCYYGKVVLSLQRFIHIGL